MNTMINSECLVKTVPRVVGRSAKWRHTGKIMRHLSETETESHSANADGRDSNPGSRLNSEAFRAELQKRASTPLYIPNQPRHWGLNE